MGVLIAAPYSVLAVLFLGKRKPGPAGPEPNTRLVMPAGQWAWRLALIAVMYVVLYFTFGYFIAWQNPQVLDYYGGVDEGSFFAHMETVLMNTSWLIPFQIMRAMIWVVIAMPVIRMMKGGRMETALAVGLIFAVVMNAQLLLPNAFMPEAVRMTHLVETASSNFIFGWLVGRLLTQRDSS
jgi:fatty acid desaturase